MTFPSSPEYFATYTLKILGTTDWGVRLRYEDKCINLSDFENYLNTLDQANCHCELPFSWHFPKADPRKKQIQVEQEHSIRLIDRFTNLPNSPPCQFCGEHDRFTLLRYFVRTPGFGPSISDKYSNLYFDYDFLESQYNRNTRASQVNKIVKKASHVGCQTDGQ